MLVETRWMIEKRVIYTRLVGDFNKKILEQMVEQVESLLETGSPPIHWVVDLTELGSVTPQISTIKDIMGFLKHPDLRWVVAYGRKNHRLVSLIGSAVAQLFSVRNRDVDTLDEAIAFLTEQDGTLDFSQVERGE